MSLPDDLQSLTRAAAYSHSCGAVEVVETHISWVLLTGEFAYKLKKPVRFAFVDFSTLERREHFCREELRCNRRFAPALYLDVVKVVRAADGSLRMDGAGEAVEWAVKMHQFDPAAQLDRLLARGGLAPDMLERFGSTLAHQHRASPARRFAAADLSPRVLQPAADNFADIARLGWKDELGDLLESTRRASDAQARRQHGRLVERLESGRIRECHGDLHLSNLVLLDSGVAAFDCLEFNEDLRWIDPHNDTAFLLMDCLVRNRPDLGYAFMDGYLDASGDYEGAALLPFYAAYRSMVRAKVAALRHDQAPPQQAGAHAERLRQHLRWTAAWLARPPGRLYLMCGLSGSGKSYLARRLAPRLPALRLRSDVMRKVQAGLTPEHPAAAEVGEGLYRTARSEQVYEALADIAVDLLASGEHVIVDATFLDPARRETFSARARAAGGAAVVIHCDAPLPVLRERLGRRSQEHDEPSDAGLAVLEHQRRTFVAPADAIRVDMAAELDDTRLTAVLERVRGGA